MGLLISTRASTKITADIAIIPNISTNCVFAVAAWVVIVAVPTIATAVDSVGGFSAAVESAIVFWYAVRVWELEGEVEISGLAPGAGVVVKNGAAVVELMGGTLVGSCVGVVEVGVLVAGVWTGAWPVEAG